MSFKSWVAKLLANKVVRKVTALHVKAEISQKQLLVDLINYSKGTQFGKDHHFEKIIDFESFKTQVPVRDYEALKNYANRVVAGESDVLYPGKPVYFAKTSGTTSGSKYIPITKDSIKTHIAAARNALLYHIYNTGNSDFVNGKMIFLQGSPELEKSNGILIGRLSGIVYHHVPNYLLKNRLPGYTTNCINDWEEKVDAVVEETIGENMTLISGIPPWVIMYFEKLRDKSGGKKIIEIFPNLSLFIHGGVNFAPYESQIVELIGKRIPMIETFPASEGFFAFQNNDKDDGLLLNLEGKMFYEFIPVESLGNDVPTRIPLWEVELNINYALVVTSNAGLWAYNVGDTVKFVSLNPYKIRVTGRTKHFLSAFGEHVIGEEVTKAMQQACAQCNAIVKEFHVAPFISEQGQKSSYHEWFVEFVSPPESLIEFVQKLDNAMCQQNEYYKDLVEGQLLQPLKLSQLQANGFKNYQKSIGKLGGQNKVGRLANGRDVANQLQPWLV